MGQYYKIQQEFTLTSLTFEMTKKTVLREIRKAVKIKLILKDITDFSEVNSRGKI